MEKIVILETVSYRTVPYKREWRVQLQIFLDQAPTHFH
jgi:hypothetical protein